MEKMTSWNSFLFVCILSNWVGMKMKLKMELVSGNRLRGWHEGAIKFAPTYKYFPNSDLYYGCCYHGHKKAPKRRSPAWYCRTHIYITQYIYT